MDPLSVTASIVGILAAAGKVGELLHGAISTAKDAPRVLISLACEVQEVRAAVFSLKLLLADLSSTQTHRAALIQIDQLIVTLADTVLTFSELETAITPFVASQGAIVSLRAKFKWLWTEDSCNKIVDRLQRHKSTLSLMLNILQCASDADANRSKSSLESMIEKLLQDNQRLGKRLRDLEDSFDAMSIVSRNMESCSLAPEADNATITSARPSASNRVSILEAVKVRFAFDDDLQASRVYRMMQNNGCDHSLASSAVRTQTWSIFSGLSLADISVISVIALPLYPDDVRDHPQYYQFGQIEPPETTATWTHAQVIVETGHSSNGNGGLPESGISRSEAPVSAPLSPVESSDTSVDIPKNHSLSETEKPERDTDNTPWDFTHGHDHTSQPLHDTPDHEGTVSGDDVPLGEAAPIGAGRAAESCTSGLETPFDHEYPSSDEEDVVYPCKGCGEILEEGKAFELAGNRWHINCFRCNTCGELLDSDANLLLLGDGSLICNKCTYNCSACGNKIEDLAILTGDQAFCATCFKCRNCKRPIENLRYARTSVGIFCMACHEALMARRRKKSRQVGAGIYSIPETERPPPIPPIPTIAESWLKGSHDAARSEPAIHSD